MGLAPLRQKVPWVASQGRGGMKTSNHAAGYAVEKKTRLRAKKIDPNLLISLTIRHMPI